MPQTNVLPDWKATYPADAKCQKPPIIATFAITAASWTTPNVTFTTSTPHGLAVGEAFTVAGVNPAGYNGTLTTIAGTTGSTVVAAMASNPGTYVSGGTLTAEVPLQINLWAQAVPNKPQWTGTQMAAPEEEEEEGTQRFAEAQDREEEDELETEPPEEDEEVEEEDENGHRRTVTRKRTVTRTTSKRRR